MNENPNLSPNSVAAPSLRKRGLGSVVRRGLAAGGVVVLLLALLLPLFNRNAASAARRVQCYKNLRQIALALEKYQAIYQALPPAHTVDSNGRPLHSWRTLMLPYLGQERLYEKIDLSKAWDDPANAEAFGAKLSVFHCYSNAFPQNHTGYLAIVGPDTCFQATESRPVSEITDNPAQTLMVIEVPVDKTVHWMNPVDADEQLVLSIGPNSKLLHNGGVSALFVDGHLQFLSTEMDFRVRRALISINGNEPVGEGSW
jgi:prepilin-type processing-associated H-X9-DG protein